MSGKYYVFVPFTPEEVELCATSELNVLEIANVWKKEAENREANRRDDTVTYVRKIPRIIEFATYAQSGMKAACGPEDTIYILGHCSPGGATLNSSRNVGMQRKQISPKLLAHRVNMCFDKRCGNFKLYGCYGGDRGNEAESFGKALFKELREYFTGCTLSAYRAAVQPNFDADGHRRSQKRIPDPDNPQDMKMIDCGRPSNSRVTYKSKGT